MADNDVNCSGSVSTLHCFGSSLAFSSIPVVSQPRRGSFAATVSLRSNSLAVTLPLVRDGCLYRPVDLRWAAPGLNRKMKTTLCCGLGHRSRCSLKLLPRSTHFHALLVVTRALKEDTHGSDKHPGTSVGSRHRVELETACR